MCPRRWSMRRVSGLSPIPCVASSSRATARSARPPSHAVSAASNSSDARRSSAGASLAARSYAWEDTSYALRARARPAACASAEDALIFQGAPGIPGLLSAKGSQSVKISPWEAVGAAADEIIGAVTALDDAGFHGPYTMGLAPRRFNLLFRRYPQGEGTELDHLRSVVTGGIYKAPVLADGGVLLASGKQFAEIVLGQDMSVGFIGPAEENLEFSVSESLVPLIHTPDAVCVLK